MNVKEESETHSKHYPQWWKIESISPKVRNKTKVPTFTTTIQHSFLSFGHSNQSRKRNKKNPNWKRRSRTLTVCRWHDPLRESESESEVTQSCPTLCDPMDCSLPGSSVHGIFQARIPDCVAISFFGTSSWPRDQTCLLLGRWDFYHWATWEAPRH